VLAVMSLYDDLPPESTSSATRPGSTLAPSVRAAASAAAAAPPPQLLRAPSLLRPPRASVIGLKKSGLRLDDAMPAANPAPTVLFLPGGDEEYDSALPNDYAIVKKAMNAAATDVLGHNREVGDMFSRPGRTASQSSDASSSSFAGDAIAADYNVFSGSLAVGSSASHHPVGPPNSAVAAMMASMGWKAGSGLGVSGQGRVDPVFAVGNDGRGGLGKAQASLSSTTKNRHANPRSRRMSSHRQPGGVYMRRLGANRVILIQNLPHVDQKMYSCLEDQVRTKCWEFGAVERVVVQRGSKAETGVEQHEEDERGLDDVRAIVVFSEPSCATAALLALDGKILFGGLARVSVYSEDLLPTSGPSDEN
jgi:G-patch domain